MHYNYLNFTSSWRKKLLCRHALKHSETLNRILLVKSKVRRYEYRSSTFVYIEACWLSTLYFSMLLINDVYIKSYIYNSFCIYVYNDHAPSTLRMFVEHFDLTIWLKQIQHPLLDWFPSGTCWTMVQKYYWETETWSVYKIQYRVFQRLHSASFM